MKKALLFVFLLLSACSSEKELMQTWLGHTKQELIAAYGQPSRLESDGRTGEVMVYGKPSTKSKSNAPSYDYRIFYLTGEGKVYSWLTKTVNTPPDKINMNTFRRY